MKKTVTLGLLLLVALYIVSGLIPPRYDSAYEVKHFARLPVLNLWVSFECAALR